MVSLLSGKKISFKYTGSELNLLACFQEQDDLFALVSKDWTLIGPHPQKIYKKWSEVKKWYTKKTKAA